MVGDTVSEIPQPSPLSIIVPEDHLNAVSGKKICVISRGMNGNDGPDKNA